MVPVLGRCCPNLLQHPIRGLGMEAEQFDQDTITTRPLANAKKLAAAGKTRDLVRGNGLMKPTESLSDLT